MSLEKMQTPHGKTSHETRFSNYEPVVPSVSMLSPPPKGISLWLDTPFANPQRMLPNM